jgi:hypothetical protein
VAAGAFLCALAQSAAIAGANHVHFATASLLDSLGSKLLRAAKRKHRRRIFSVTGISLQEAGAFARINDYGLLAGTFWVPPSGSSFREVNSVYRRFVAAAKRRRGRRSLSLVALEMRVKGGFRTCERHRKRTNSRLKAQKAWADKVADLDARGETLLGAARQKFS